MKIKGTLMTENDKHLNETYTKEKIEEEAVKGWEALGSILSAISGGDSMIVEKCELLER